MRVFITGGTGLIGRHLVRRLAERGDQPVILSRHSDQARRDPSMRMREIVPGDPTTSGAWQNVVDGCDAVVNLAGHNIFEDRWNSQVKRKIRDSRVYGTENLVAAIAKAKNAPKVMVQSSAIGYYGTPAEAELTEESPSGSDFMAVVCREWEEAAHHVEALGVRLSVVRTGIVLERGAGALGVMVPIFKWPLGAAPIGNGGSLVKPATGQQWMSWIHIDDIVGILLLALDNPAATGPINGTAPHPVRNAEFSKALARSLWRPCAPFGPPDPLLKLVLGEVADVITKGQKVLPTRALALGYSFKYPTLDAAMKALFAKPAVATVPKPEPSSAVKSGHHH
ncbi:TIGR01777 family oxidoreductase [Singulisphaera sp. Ch08]|uniref:TIGR01777 family oxidoreductase n=1 Tax=Singulisphaera sp. Ch08 TaxID=3120278 RepID=A0AAU7CF85_9BACT